MFMFFSASVFGQVETPSPEKNIEERNSLCRFGFDSRGIYSMQNANNDYIVYEVPGMSASDLKGAALSAISSHYKSPKDVVTSLGDNIIQLETFASSVYVSKAKYPHDMSYSIIIQFKDGKIRYNIPTVKQIWASGTILGSLKLDMSKSLSTLVEGSDRQSVAKEFNNLVDYINKKIKESDDW